MKAIAILFIMLFTCQIVNADVYLTYNDSTKEVIDMSKREDVVLQDGWTRIKLPGILTDYPLQYHPQYYKYDNERFIVNIEKLSTEANEQALAAEKAKELEKIKNKQLLTAKKELEKEGVSFKYINDSDFE